MRRMRQSAGAEGSDVAALSAVRRHAPASASSTERHSRRHAAAALGPWRQRQYASPARTRRRAAPAAAPAANLRRVRQPVSVAVRSATFSRALV
eukprot:1994308-Pleurochrysis_carterae.AAC.2